MLAYLKNEIEKMIGLTKSFKIVLLSIGKILVGLIPIFRLFNANNILAQ
jgi:hypothetical protein